MIRLAHDCYRSKAEITGFETADVFTELEHCRIYHNEEEIIVTFEGSISPFQGINPKSWRSKESQWDDSIQHLLRGLDYGRMSAFFKLKMIPNPLSNEAMVHPGFARQFERPALESNTNLLSEVSFEDAIALELQTIMEKHPSAPVSFCGHSSGGALAVIEASKVISGSLLKDRKNPLGEIYTFGCPRVGNEAFAEAIQNTFGNRYFRFEIVTDPVPSLPFKKNGQYIHAGQCIPIDVTGRSVEVTTPEGRDSMASL